jgi:hypothetical protein
MAVYGNLPVIGQSQVGWPLVVCHGIVSRNNERRAKIRSSIIYKRLFTHYFSVLRDEECSTRPITAAVDDNLPGAVREGSTWHLVLC